MTEIMEILFAMATIAGRELSPVAAKLLGADLSPYPHDAVIKALAKCRMEVRGFPSLAEIVSRIDDGRPGVEEAWALVPKDESETVVWTSEAREAHALACSLSDDPIAARMAFKEKYTKLVADARAGRVPVQWHASLGHDSMRRDRALLTATEQGKLSRDYVAGLLPDDTPPQSLQIEGPVSPDLSRLSVVDFIAKIKAQLRDGDA